MMRTAPLAFGPAEKPCRVCRTLFLPVRPMQVVCGFRCATRVPVVARREAAADRRKTRERIAELRPLAYWRAQAQAAFNAWIRIRDAARPCISCGTTTAAQWDAGHYLTAGARPELRFDEANCHKQCSVCNQHFSGNVARYRMELLRRIGQAEVDRLEGPGAPQQLRRERLQAVRDDYRARVRAAIKEKG